MKVAMNRTVLKQMVVSAAVWAGAIAAARGSIIIDGFNTAANDRFANSGSFVAVGYDLSGVALNGTWATMVSSNVFLSANHYHPSVGGALTFYSSNDPSGGSVARTVLAGQRIGTSDLWIGVLNSPLPGGYAYYDFATEDIWNLSQFALSPYAGENAFLFGRSSTAWPISQDMAVGRNVLDVWYDEISSGVDAIGSVVNITGDTNYVTYEAYLQGGDSGGGMFVDDGTGDLKLVGINWFISTIGTKNGNGQSYVGNYNTEISAFVAAHQIPEPSALVLLLWACIPLACSLRPKRKQ